MMYQLNKLCRHIFTYGGTVSTFSKICAAICLLPASFIYYKGIENWNKNFLRGKPFFTEILHKFTASQYIYLPRLPRYLVKIGFISCLSIRQCGIVQSLLKFIKVCLSGNFISSYRSWSLQHISIQKSQQEDEQYDRFFISDYRIPQADTSAGELATVGILRDIVRLGYKVDFIPANLAPSEPYRQQIRNLGVNVITWEDGYISLSDYLEQNAYKYSIFYLIRKEVAYPVIDIIRRCAPTATIIFHAPDVNFVRELREAEVLGAPECMVKALKGKEEELFIMGLCDRVIAISKNDADTLTQEGVTTPISIFPGLYVPVADEVPPFAVRKDMFFIGGFAHRPNIDAMVWFCKDIWPYIHVKLPNVIFHIVGSEAPASIRDLGCIPGINIIGYIADLSPLLASMRVSVVPLRYGAGIKGKVALTLGSGIPCVCTDIAAEGMHIKDGVHAIIGNDIHSIADSAVKLYTEEMIWNVISKKGQDLVKDNFGEISNRRAFIDILNQSRILPTQLYMTYCSSLQPSAVPTINCSDPYISIIIPVYNKWCITRTCLNSLIDELKRCHIPSEVLLADDGSTDDTVHAENIFPGVRRIRTPKNMGFLRNCNYCAKYTIGKYIILLNNDTIVMPGWLSSLYNTAEEQHDAAIVGSKILFKDGSIQEAGGVLFCDGTGMNVGRGENRYTKELCVEREVDYISGCSILIRKSFWEHIGGFDEQYGNAYFEDADLAMSAHALGMHVVYQPLSELIHLEGTSYDDSKKEKLMTKNRALFVKKWTAHGLSTHMQNTSQWREVLCRYNG